jgi:hypothetical protein
MNLYKIIGITSIWTISLLLIFFANIPATPIIVMLGLGTLFMIV